MKKHAVVCSFLSAHCGVLFLHGISAEKSQNFIRAPPYPQAVEIKRFGGIFMLPEILNRKNIFYVFSEKLPKRTFQIGLGYEREKPFLRIWKEVDFFWSFLLPEKNRRQLGLRVSAKR
jgi:hypothetical protein